MFLPPTYFINKKWTLPFNREISFSWRSSKNAWGRFGGGWNWKLDFQAGCHTIIVSLLVFEITYSKRWQKPA